jgi:hypothetical protein
MSARGAFGKYGYGNSKRKTESKENKGNKVEDNVDENGKTVPTYKFVNKPDACITIRNGIKLAMGVEFPIIGQELTTSELSKYSLGPAMPEEESSKPVPIGLGPRPGPRDGRLAEYEKNVGALRKRWVTDQGAYVKEVSKAKSKILNGFVAPSVLTAIQKNPAIIQAQKEGTSVSEFLDVVDPPVA